MSSGRVLNLLEFRPHFPLASKQGMEPSSAPGLPGLGKVGVRFPLKPPRVSPGAPTLLPPSPTQAPPQLVDRSPVPAGRQFFLLLQLLGVLPPLLRLTICLSPLSPWLCLP